MSQVKEDVMKTICGRREMQMGPWEWSKTGGRERAVKSDLCVRMIDIVEFDHNSPL